MASKKNTIIGAKVLPSYAAERGSDSKSTRSFSPVLLGAGDENATEEKESSATSLHQEVLRKIPTASVLPMMRGKGKGTRPYLRMVVRDVFADELACNNASGKYLCVLSSATTRSWTSLLSNLLELSSYQALFQELFVRQIEVWYEPNNMNSSNLSASSSAAGSPGQLNTCGAVFVFLPDNVPPLSDLSTAFQKAMLQRQHKVFNMAERFRHVFSNPTKFDWNGPLADQASGTTDMGWMSFTQAISNTKLGGMFQVPCCYATGAATGIGDLLDAGKLGFIFYRVTLALRVRV